MNIKSIETFARLLRSASMLLKNLFSGSLLLPNNRSQWHDARAALTATSNLRSKVAPTWLPFIRVLNVADSLRQAEKLGGKILGALRADLLDGHVAVIAREKIS